MPPQAPRDEGRYREASISEFFEKNRHILGGFDSPPQKALFMAVKEALDNSLDACEEFSILPEISISIDRQGGDVFTVTVADNGPGIKRRFIPEVFGRLLYGSRFHSFRQSRGGQQGIGITAAVLYGQISTGQPSRIVSKTEDEDVGYEVVMGIDVARNRADIHSEKPVIVGFEHGTVVSMPPEGGKVPDRQTVCP
ncbi:ATP-binding protein [Thermogymnomonas acidicola]|uniref:ATP-binding protein n=1 Tax=Thermogymnomonas acidicola TaxID=399579 RepID=UPI000946362C|nr:ATP-binding protein [Thermogymnomonas acidicola]